MVRFLQAIRLRSKMKFSAGKILFIIVLVVFPSIMPRESISISDKQQILFEYEFVNYALDYQHYGYIIDNEGNVLTYMDPEKWNFPDRSRGLVKIR